MADELSALAARWRAEGCPRDSRGSAISMACRERALRRLLRMRISPQRSEELAQEVTVRVLAAIKAGTAEPGLEAGLVARAAFNAGVSWLRSPGNSPTEPVPDDRLASTQRTEQIVEANSRLQAIREELSTAPPAYRRAIEALLEGRDVSDLARTDVEEKVVRGEIERDDEMAQATEFARLRSLLQRQRNRAQAWLASRLRLRGWD
jgi:DNA-directed RNA polymerase specialized sigma24 family protein